MVLPVEFTARRDVKKKLAELHAANDAQRLDMNARLDDTLRRLSDAHERLVKAAAALMARRGLKAVR